MDTQIKTRRQHFVTFYSPGTFVDETDCKPIEAWDTAAAVSMAKGINQRHGAKPYGFRFHTSLVADPVADGEGGTLKVEPRMIAESGTHYIDGVLFKLDELEAVADPDKRILVQNMRGNDMPVVCETRIGYRHTGEFREVDCVVDGETGAVADRGDSPDWKQYRKETIERVKRERGY